MPSPSRSATSNNNARPVRFSLSLLLLGIALGFTLSVKWVGFCVIALAGLHTIKDLYELLGDLRNSYVRLAGHFAIRALMLIAVPLALYAASFVVHIKVLNQSGPGDSNMPSLFQATLNGTHLAGQPRGSLPVWHTGNPSKPSHRPVVTYGSVVTLRNQGLSGGLLHSHVQSYPQGSKQQQVTCYRHQDDNNYWQVIHPTLKANDVCFLFSRHVL